MTTTLEENDELFNLLTSSWDPQQSEAVRNSIWTRDYLTRLTSLSLDDLLREPVDLRAEQEKLQQDAQQLAFEDYPAFIHAQTCRRQVDGTLNELDDHLSDFLASVPGLQAACETFSASAKVLAQERSKVTRVLEHQNVLVELLEIPQLMQTCVRNGYYSEAMDLASHVRLLYIRYPLPVVQSIKEQVQALSDLMLVQLIDHLRRPIKLAATMNVIGHLRRMDAFESETELRMVFLRCRHDFLEQRLDRIKRVETSEEKSSQEAFEYLKRYIDVMREQMFEIATHYMSVFPHQDSSSITILSNYMIHLIRTMKATLESHLKWIKDASSLASLLTQIQYCGMSLGRIGLDFRQLFVQGFEDTMRPLILKQLDDATSDLVASISAAEKGGSQSLWMSASKLGSLQTQSDDVRRQNQPPMLLVDYPPLAVFTNAVLSAFNSLRLLPAVGLLKPIQSHLDACFLEVGGALKQYADLITSRSPAETAVVQSFTAAYVRCCVPFLKSCLRDGIYGDVPQEETTGIDDSDLEALLSQYLPRPAETTAYNVDYIEEKDEEQPDEAKKDKEQSDEVKEDEKQPDEVKKDEESSKKATDDQAPSGNHEIPSDQ